MKGQLSRKTDGIKDMLTGLKKKKKTSWVKISRAFQEWHWIPFWSDLSECPFCTTRAKIRQLEKSLCSFRLIHYILGGHHQVLWLCVYAKSLYSCLTLCDPMDCSLPDSSVHGVLQARILRWVAMPCHGSSRSRDPTCLPVSCTGRWVPYH